MFDAVQTLDELSEACPLAAEVLRPLRVIPDVGIFELAAYFFEALAFGWVVKDTP